MTTNDALIRQERLATRVGGLRVRQHKLASRDNWMLIIGGALVPLGVVLILLGWLGASATPLVFEQVPYLISGGVLGLALVFVGGFVYFAYWLTLLVRENRSTREDLVAVLSRMERLLEEGSLKEGSLGQGSRKARSTRTARTPAGSYAGELVATKTGSMIHRPDCVAVDGRDNLRAVTDDTTGLTPCRLCDPLEA
jgi:hypothetical protein